MQNFNFDRRLEILIQMLIYYFASILILFLLSINSYYIVFKL